MPCALLGGCWLAFSHQRRVSDGIISNRKASCNRYLGFVERACIDRSLVVAGWCQNPDRVGPPLEGGRRVRLIFPSSWACRDDQSLEVRPILRSGGLDQPWRGGRRNTGRSACAL
ncbi:hypothetical protein BDV10DRAFT_64505 [Aspergillus recurvatus]